MVLTETDAKRRPPTKMRVRTTKHRNNNVTEHFSEDTIARKSTCTIYLYSTQIVAWTFTIQSIFVYITILIYLIAIYIYTYTKLYTKMSIYNSLPHPAYHYDEKSPTLQPAQKTNTKQNNIPPI